MTVSMKFIPVPQEIYDILGFTDEGVFTAEISEGKLVLTQESDRKCILPPEAEVDCEDCCFCCKCCGECMADQFISREDDDKEFCYEVQINNITVSGANTVH